MWTFLLSAFIVINPNPAMGPHGDWAPLMQEYQDCADAANSYFQYVVCTTGAYDRAIHPTYFA